MLPRPSSLRTAVVPCVLLLGLSAALAAAKPAPQPACFEDWWRGQVEALRAARGGADALVPLRSALELRRTANDPFELLAAVDAVRALPDTDPLVAAEIDDALLDADLDRALHDAAAARRTRLGLVPRWLVAGPFAGTTVPDGVLADLASAGPPRTSRFRPLETGPDGLLPLNQAMYPPTRGTALAVAYVKLARPAAVAVRWGADDRATLAIDGHDVAAPEGRHDLAFDQHAAFVQLAAGWHRLLFRVEQDDGTWLLSARLTDPDGRPFGPDVLTFAAAGEAARIEREIAGAEPRPATGRTLLAALEEAARRGTPRAKAQLAQDLAARDLPDRRDPRSITLVREARAAAPHDRDVLWIAAVIDSDPARRREALEALIADDPTHPAALRRLAGYHLEYGRTDASLAETERALTACGRPDPYLAGWRALARDGRGFAVGALAALAPLVAAAPRQVAILERYADISYREGMPARARAAMEQHLALEAGNDRLRAEYVDLLVNTGDAGALRRAFEAALVRDPYDVNWRSRFSRFLLGAGLGDQALLNARAGLALAPDNPALLEAEGEALLAAGDERGAAEAWKRARAIAQDAGSLGERIAALTGADDSFGADWTVSLDDARAIEAKTPVDGDPPYVVISHTAAYRVRPDGLGTKFQQVILRVRHPEQSNGARSFGFSYSPTMETPTIIAARLIRKDGSVLLAGRNERPLLPDPEIRMWYDTRVVDVGFTRLEEGDLIDLRYRVTDRGGSSSVGDGYFGDVWMAGDDVPVLAPRIALENPADRPLSWKLVNVDAARVNRERRGDVDVTVLELPKLPAYQAAPFSPPLTARLPYAVIGSAKDWPALAASYARLARDQATPGPDVEVLVRQLVQSAGGGRRERLRAIYDWVIENTRYVALEFGIHALKPYDVPSVYHRRFGDCKDKATLLYAMLRLAGIDARVALVRTRDRGPLDTTVPVFAAFDHAIVYVPNDDLWLDGTVQHHALGEVPGPDRGALALIVDPQGKVEGRLVTIPEMTPPDAAVERIEEVELDRAGTAVVGVQVAARGDEAGRERSYFRAQDRPMVILANRLRHAFPDLDLLDAKFDDVGLDDPVVRFRYKARVPRFARPEGDGLSVPLALIVPELPVGRPPAGRDIPLDLPQAFSRKLKARIAVPDGFAVRELPRGETLDTPWGRLVVKVQEARHAVDVNIDFDFLGGTVPVTKIPEYAAFVERASHALEGRMVFAQEAR